MNSILPLLQIVSGFSPDVDGMGDFSRHIGNALLAERSVQSHFLVYRRPRQPLNVAEIAPNSISYPPEAKPTALLNQALELVRSNRFRTVLLHYGPYAYSRDGKPNAFQEAITDLASKTRMLVYFHELYATGKPWRRSFWTNSEQRKSVSNLLAGSIGAFTSNDEYLEKLQNLNQGNRPLTKIPVISNVGEPTAPPPLVNRKRRMVAFGQAANRGRLYKEHRLTLEKICKKLEVEEWLDVGSGDISAIPKTIGDVPVHMMGRLDDGPLSSLLANSAFGIVAYWPDVWEKSGVIAAYQAHAMIPILIPLQPRKIAASGPLPYVLPELILDSLSDDSRSPSLNLQSMADNAYNLYRANQSVARCVEVISPYII